MMSCVIEFSFLFILLGSATASTPDLVGEICKKIAAEDSNVDRAFCVESLRQPAAAARDLRGLAVAATRVVATNASGEKAAAKAALKKVVKKGQQRKSWRSPLQTCRELFSGSASELKEAADKLAAGSIDIDTVRVRLSATVTATETCEDSFRESGVPSPLAKEDRDLRSLAVIALVITTLLR